MELAFEFEAPQYLESLEEAAVGQPGDEPDNYFAMEASQSVAARGEGKKCNERTPRRLWSSNPMRENIEIYTSKAVENSNTSSSKLSLSVSVPNKTTFEGIDLLPITPSKKHSMMTRQYEKLTTPTLELRNRSVIKRWEMVGEEDESSVTPFKRGGALKVKEEPKTPAAMKPQTPLQPTQQQHDNDDTTALNNTIKADIDEDAVREMGNRDAGQENDDNGPVVSRNRLKRQASEESSAPPTKRQRIVARPKLESKTARSRRSTWKRKCSPQAAKYLTLAEQAYHFQYDTPPRFHTKHPGEGPPKVDFKPLMPTIPMTPKLVTRQRAAVYREREHIDTKQEPADLSVTKDSCASTKKATGPSRSKNQPLKQFNWTNNKAKKEEPFEFKAKLAPESKTQDKKRTTAPVCPEVKLNLVSGVPCVSATSGGKSDFHQVTIYDRGQAMMLRKKEKIMKILEENKNKVRVFRARPAPHYVTSSTTANTTSSRSTRHSKCIAASKAHIAFG